MGNYGKITFYPEYAMIDWEAKPYVTIGTFEDRFHCRCWKDIESRVRWGNNKFISAAELIYIIYDVILPFDSDLYRKGWRSMDDFHETDATVYGGDGYAREYRDKLTVNPPIAFTDDECRTSLEWGHCHKNTREFFDELQRVSTWAVTYECLKRDPVQWVTETIIVHCSRYNAVDRADAEIKKKNYEWYKFVDCNEQIGGNAND
jgi:hypothetical protein